jgi:hypothetical protein
MSSMIRGDEAAGHIIGEPAKSLMTFGKKD